MFPIHQDVADLTTFLIVQLPFFSLGAVSRFNNTWLLVCHSSKHFANNTREEHCFFRQLGLPIGGVAQYNNNNNAA